MLNREDTIMVLVDVQGKLAEIVHEKDSLYSALDRLIRGMQAMRIPIIWMEQIPEKMGPTVPQIAGLLGGIESIPKVSFSCWGDARFIKALEESGRKTVVLAGIETHVCVYQTAMDLVARGFHVEVVADAVSSRTLMNKETALRRMGANGVGVISTEMILFELLKTSAAPEFKDMLRIVK